MKVYFSDYFEINPKLIDKYGAFNISLVTDLPLFIDPFLLWNSKKKEYKVLHDHMIEYLRFLKEKSKEHNIKSGLLQAWFKFPEVEQNWLGFSVSGNRGRGLGNSFAVSLYENLGTIFSTFGKENVTKGSHLEKLCLIKDGVGRDNISDFTTNLIKEYLLNYTEIFANKYLNKKYLKSVIVEKVRFNNKTLTWESDKYTLPFYKNDYVLLTPKDILTKDDTWINRGDLNATYSNIDELPNAISNQQLRAQVEQYILSQLPEKEEDVTTEDRNKAVLKAIHEFPELIDIYIRSKENNASQATDISSEKVRNSDILYVRQFGQLVREMSEKTDFYKYGKNTYEEAIRRLQYLKDFIENKGGYRLLYSNNNSIKHERDIHLLYRLAWYATPSDVSMEVNDGMGPADSKVSRGSKDKTIVEFKLATNSQLKRNLVHQTEIYQKASDANNSIKVILYFSEEQHVKVVNILKSLKMDNNKNIILIDARRDNKVSASKAC